MLLTSVIIVKIFFLRNDSWLPLGKIYVFAYSSFLLSFLQYLRLICAVAKQATSV